MTTEQPNSNPRLAWLALAVVLILTGLVRYRMLDVPLERDEGEYAYAGQLILQGVPPYQEVSNMKFPGTYAAYALILSIFGQTHQGIHAGLLLINAVTILSLFLLAKQLVNSLCAVVTAASFALLSLSQSVQGVYANAEHFVLVCAVGGLLLTLQSLETANTKKLYAAGCLLGLSFVMKQHGIAFSGFAICHIAYDSFRNRPIMWRRMFRNLLVFTAGSLTVFGLLCVIMAWSGVFAAFWFWTFEYAAEYVSQVPFEEAITRFQESFSAIFFSAPLLWGLAGLGLIGLLTGRIAKPQRVYLLILTAFSALAICPGFFFRPHYFVLLLPCASLLCGVAISIVADYLSRRSFNKLRYAVPAALIALCLIQSIYTERDYLFRMTPFQVSRSTFGPPFSESLEIAKFIQEHTEPHDRIAVLGSEPEIFFYSKRRSASSYIYMYPLMENHDFAFQMQQNFINQVEAANPKFVVFIGMPGTWYQRPESHMLIFQWFDNYVRRGDAKLVGVIEAVENESLYHWGSDVKWPVESPFWVTIYERKS